MNGRSQILVRVRAPGRCFVRSWDSDSDWPCQTAIRLDIMRAIHSPREIADFHKLVKRAYLFLKAWKSDLQGSLQEEEQGSLQEAQQGSLQQAQQEPLEQGRPTHHQSP